MSFVPKCSGLKSLSSSGLHKPETRQVSGMREPPVELLSANRKYRSHHALGGMYSLKGDAGKFRWHISQSLRNSSLTMIMIWEICKYLGSGMNFQLFARLFQ